MDSLNSQDRLSFPLTDLIFFSTFSLTLQKNSQKKFANKIFYLD